MDDVAKIVKCVIDPSLIDHEDGLRKELAVAIIDLIRKVLTFHHTNLMALCQDFPTRPFELGVKRLFKEMFSEGTSWHKVATVFAFCHILATKNTKYRHSLEKVLPAYIYELLPWINDNGGWNGLIILSKQA